MRIRGLIYLVLIVMLALAGCGATPGAPDDPPGADDGGGDGPPTDGPGGETRDEPGPALPNMIAYVVGDGADEIRVIAPDGSGDRSLWAHGRADPEGVAELWDLDWSPDARQIAFTGTHEFDCSIHHSDVYAVGTNGGNYRRLSGPPDCASLDELPSATVNVPVRNDSLDSIDIFMYFLGASGAEQISLPPGGRTTITFDDVADLGDGADQYGMMIQPDGRYLAANTAIDVQAGETHTTAEQGVWASGSPGWEARSPSWHADGSRVGYVYGFNTIYGQDAFPELLTLGDELLTTDEMANTVWHVNWNPAAAWAGELLYVGWSGGANGIHLVGEGSTTPGDVVIDLPSYEEVIGLAWLPDGNGFVYSVSQDFGAASNLWWYSLESDAATQITDFTDEFAGELSVSPDGREIVFERASAVPAADRGVIDPDLWIVGLDGSGLELLVEGGRAPAWSR